MFSAQMPSAPWTAASEGMSRRTDGLVGGWPGAYRRGAPHSQRDRASSPVSFAREAWLNVRPIRAFCGRSRACSCGRARRSGRPAIRRRPRGTDSADRHCETWRDRARARSRALLAEVNVLQQQCSRRGSQDRAREHRSPRLANRSSHALSYSQRPLSAATLPRRSGSPPPRSCASHYNQPLHAKLRINNSLDRAVGTMCDSVRPCCPQSAVHAREGRAAKPERTEPRYARLAALRPARIIRQPDRPLRTGRASSASHRAAPNLIRGQRPRSDSGQGPESVCGSEFECVDHPSPAVRA
jgi:hypothetical protein